MKIAILGTRGIPNNYGGFEQCAEHLSVGLVAKGHNVSIYNPNFHPYKESSFKGVKIIRKESPQQIFGNSISNFIYDYLCLKDAIKKDFDIILELGLITSSLSIIFCRNKDKIIVTNLDGMEWKRLKWNKIVQKVTKSLEKYGVMFSDYLIADNIGIQKYLLKEYGRKSEMIAYGAEMGKKPDAECLKKYGLEKNNYFLSIARLEPENNLEMMFNAYTKSRIQTPYILIGNHLTPYGNFLKNKYRGSGILFLGGIFNKDHLDNIRFYSKYYLHGHSVGGTNPALLEAMEAKTFILSHNNLFNKSVTENNAFYFSNSDELVCLLKNDALLDHKESFVLNNSKKIKACYRWEVIINKYEAYFKRILTESNQQ